MGETLIELGKSFLKNTKMARFRKCFNIFSVLCLGQKWASASEGLKVCIYVYVWTCVCVCVCVCAHVFMYVCM